MIDYSNSQISAVIDEHIHNIKYREILKDRLIDGLTFSEIADKRNYSERQIKNIVYRNFEKIFDFLS